MKNNFVYSLLFILSLSLFACQRGVSQNSNPICTTVGETTSANAWGEADVTFLNPTCNPTSNGKFFTVQNVVYNSIQGDDDAHDVKVNILMPLEAEIYRVEILEQPGVVPANESGSCHAYILSLGQLNRTEPNRKDFKEKKRTIRVTFRMTHPRVRTASIGMFAYPMRPSDKNPANNYCYGMAPVTEVSASN